MKNRCWSLPFRFPHVPLAQGSVPTRAKRRKSRGYQPKVEKLEDRFAPALTAVGAGPGGPPVVTILNQTGDVVTSFNAFDPGFTGGVHVATADFTGDGNPDVIAGAGPGAGPHVKVFDGVTFAEVQSFFAYDPGFAGGVNVAAFDLNVDGRAEIITGAGPGAGPHVKVFDGSTLVEIQSYFAYDAGFTGGVNVTVADLSGEGRPDIITGPGVGGGPNVNAFDGTTGALVVSFFAYDPSFGGGVNVAAGNFDGNGTANLATGPGPGGGPNVRVWNVAPLPTLLAEFAALDGVYDGGVEVGSLKNDPGSPDSILATSQSIVGPVLAYNLAGQILDTSNISGLGGGFSLSSNESQQLGAPPTPTTDELMPIEGNMTGSSIPQSVVFFNPNDPVNTLPEKKITVTNNSSTKIIYPFFTAPNTGQSPINSAYYDPIDDPNNGYRAYIGYQFTDGKYYFGLQPNASVTISIPLVFWDSGHLYFGTDSKYLKNDLQNADNTGVPSNNINNPYLYYRYDFVQGVQKEVRRYIDDHQTVSSSASKGVTNKPVVLYYHSVLPPVDPNTEAPDQLFEISIRDPKQQFLTFNGKVGPANPNGELGPLISYDISNVDSTFLPGALEAPLANVPQTIVQANVKTQKPFGWVGAPQTIGQFQTAFGDASKPGALNNFTSPNTPTQPNLNGLGQYFGGIGWNAFFTPRPADTGIKVPATKNIFEASPLRDVLSTYSTTPGINDRFKMAAGGEILRVATGFSNNKPSATVGSPLITDVDPTVLAQLANGMQNINNNTFPVGTVIVPSQMGDPANSIRLSANAGTNAPNEKGFTFVGSIYTGYAGSTTGDKLTLDNPSLVSNLKANMLVSKGETSLGRIKAILPDSSNPYVQHITLDSNVGTTTGPYTFKGAVTDFVAERLLQLWYAWADYYVGYVSDPAQQAFTGQLSQTATLQTQTGEKIATNKRVLQFTNAITEQLYPGMVVTSPGNLPAGTTIYSISADKKTILLSQYALGTASTSPINLTVALPTQIPRTSPIVPTNDLNPLKLSFSSAAQAKAVQFATTVYAVMKSFGNIPGNFPPAGFDQNFFDSLAFMQNIIGGNIGQIPNIGSNSTNGKTDVSTNIALDIRDASKSLERGVFDFNKVSDASGQWYPIPSTATPGASFTRVTDNGSKTVDANFNVYCLDPYVTFSHADLGVSAYAFSLDDDKANPTVAGATSLLVSVGGLTGFPNLYEWSPGAPFGPVASDKTTNSPVTGQLNAATQPPQISNIQPNSQQLSAFDYVGNISFNENTGALVIGPGIQGNVVAQIGGGDATHPPVDQNNGLVRLLAGPSYVSDAAATNYSFFGNVYATGTIDPHNAPHTISNIDPEVIKALNAITINGSLLPNSTVLVSGRGITASSPVSGTATFGVGQFPTGVTVGDFNGDGKPDAAVANYGPTGGDSVSVLLGNGNGTFQPGIKVNLGAGTNPFAIATGKFTAGSNNLSIVTGNWTSKSLSVIVGNGDGTFKPPVTIPAKDSNNDLHNVFAVATGDLNGDTKDDIAIASADGTYNVLLGNGNGTFQALPWKSALTPIYGIGIGNIDSGAGPKPSLIVAAAAAYKVGVLPGNGDGTFKDPIFSNVLAGENRFLGVGDFNKDNKIDVATSLTDFANVNQLVVLLGNGNGTFGPANSFAVGKVPFGVTVSDIDKDGNLDVAVANLGSFTGSVLLGNGNGSFAPAQSFSAGVFPFGVAAGDFNANDAALDLVFTNFNGRQIDTLTLAQISTGQSVTRLKSIGATSVELSGPPLDINQAAGEYRFRFF